MRTYIILIVYEHYGGMHTKESSSFTEEFAMG